MSTGGRSRSARGGKGGRGNAPRTPSRGDGRLSALTGVSLDSAFSQAGAPAPGSNPYARIYTPGGSSSFSSVGGAAQAPAAPPAPIGNDNASNAGANAGTPVEEAKVPGPVDVNPDNVDVNIHASAQAPAPPAASNLEELSEQMQLMMATLNSLNEKRDADATRIAQLEQEKAELEIQRLKEREAADAAVKLAVANANGGSKLQTGSLVNEPIKKWLRDHVLKCKEDFGPQLELFLREGLAGAPSVYKTLITRELFESSMGNQHQFLEVDAAFAAVLATWPDDPAVCRSLHEIVERQLPSERSASDPFLCYQIVSELRSRRRIGNSALTVSRETLAFDLLRFREGKGNETESYCDFKDRLREEARRIRDRIGGKLPTEEMADKFWLRVIGCWARPTHGRDRYFYDLCEKKVFDYIEDNIAFELDCLSSGRARDGLSENDFPHPLFLRPDHVSVLLAACESESKARSDAHVPSIRKPAAVAAKVEVSKGDTPVTNEFRLAGQKHPAYAMLKASCAKSKLPQLERKLGKEVQSGKITTGSQPAVNAAAPASSAAGGNDMVQMSKSDLEAMLAKARSPAISPGVGANSSRPARPFGPGSCLWCGATDHGRFWKHAQVRQEGKCPYIQKGVSPAESMAPKVSKDGGFAYEACWQCGHFGHAGYKCFQQAWWGGRAPFGETDEGKKVRAAFESRAAGTSSAGVHAVEAAAPPPIVGVASDAPASASAPAATCPKCNRQASGPFFMSALGFICNICNVTSVDVPEPSFALVVRGALVVSDPAFDPSESVFSLQWLLGGSLSLLLLFLLLFLFFFASVKILMSYLSARSQERMNGFVWSRSSSRVAAMEACRAAIDQRVRDRIRSRSSAAVASAPPVSQMVQSFPEAIPVASQVSFFLVAANDSRLDRLWPSGTSLPPGLHVASWQPGPALAPRQWWPPNGNPPRDASLPVAARCGALIVFGISRQKFQGCGYWRCPRHGAYCFFQWQPVPLFSVDSRLLLP